MYHRSEGSFLLFSPSITGLIEVCLREDFNGTSLPIGEARSKQWVSALYSHSCYFSEALLLWVQKLWTVSSSVGHCAWTVWWHCGTQSPHHWPTHSNLHFDNIQGTLEWVLITGCSDIHPENGVFEHQVIRDKTSNVGHPRWLPRHSGKFPDCPSAFASHLGLCLQLSHCCLTPLSSSKGGSGCRIAAPTSLLTPPKLKVAEYLHCLHFAHLYFLSFL